jgi:curved DNA-binding protein CbpA
LIDYYKTLNVDFEASETEIKKQFRKLASIHHPDKNGGSKKSEETFKLIINAYETLSDSQKRTIYDIKYRQHFQQPQSEPTNQSNTSAKHEDPKSSTPRYKEYQQSKKTKPKVTYRFWVVVVLVLLLYLYNTNIKTTTGNPKADQQLEDQQPENRPQSGELDFNK